MTCKSNSTLEMLNILVCVTGGIAAYKSPELVRLLRKKGANVRVILSQGGKKFVTELTLQTVSGNPVSNDGCEHIELAKWAHIIIIAPLSANRLAALAHGFADDLIAIVYLATKARIFAAPSMNKQMWIHPSVQSNIEIIKSHNVIILHPTFGEQACGDIGIGCMMEPKDIVEIIC